MLTRHGVSLIYLFAAQKNMYEAFLKRYKKSYQEKNTLDSDLLHKLEP